MKPNSKEARIVRLVEAASYVRVDPETGHEFRIRLQVGAEVSATTFGIARPTYQGGGKHLTATDLNTGCAFEAIVEELPGR